MSEKQFEGDAASFANTARAQVAAFVENLEEMVSRGRDLLVDMDARLETFDVVGSRRIQPTEREKRAAASSA